MTQEEKELLLIDLSARLPYGVKGTVEIEVSTGEYSIESGHLLFMEKEIDVELLGINKETEEIEVYPLNDINLDGYDYVINDFIPYLRPMSSMTKKENEEYLSIWTGSIRGDMIAKIDFYLKHHFDFRLTSEGLSMIEAGLALEAPKGMYD